MAGDKPIKHFKQNDKGRDFVVGDIHGCFDLLKFRLGEIEFNDEIDRLFSVGDLVDRGLESEDCIKWINKPWFHAVRGNHEQMAIDYVNGLGEKGHLIQNGGAWFVCLIREEQRCFIEMFGDLPIAIEVETKNGLVGIVHADCPFNDWNDLKGKIDLPNVIECCLWDRNRLYSQDKTPIKNIDKVYFGHTPAKEITMLGNCIYIDTGAVFNGNLTILEL